MPEGYHQTFRESFNGKAGHMTIILMVIGMIATTIVYAENNYLKRQDLDPISEQIDRINGKIDDLIVLNKISALSVYISKLEKQISFLESKRQPTQREQIRLSSLKQERERKLSKLVSLQAKEL